MGFESIVGQSEAIRAAASAAHQRAAIHDVPVLILGESGTGKEMFAEAIHRASHRRDKPYHMINCMPCPAALSSSRNCSVTSKARLRTLVRTARVYSSWLTVARYSWMKLANVT